MNKRGENNLLMNLALIVIIAVGLNVATNGAIFKTFGATAPTGDGTPPPASGGIDIGDLIDGTIEFTAKNAYLQGTAITGQNARVLNDGVDEGQISVASGTVSATPKDELKIYCFENSTNGGSQACLPSGTCYYTNKQYLTYPKDERVKISCQGYQIDLSPTITMYNDDDQPNTAQAISASEKKTMTVKVQAAADKAYGNPSVSKGNALCIRSNSTEFVSAKVTTRVDSNMDASKLSIPTAKPISMPYNLTAVVLAGETIRCFEIDKVADNGWVKYALELEASSTDPIVGSTGDNIYLKDVDLELNADDLTEIESYEDEDNNVIGAHVLNKTIEYS